MWRLPLHEEYDELIKGNYGDLDNAPEARKAGTIVGGAFLANFVGETPWAHLDIAGSAWDSAAPTSARAPRVRGAAAGRARTLVCQGGRDRSRETLAFGSHPRFGQRAAASSLARVKHTSLGASLHRLLIDHPGEPLKMLVTSTSPPTTS